MKQITRNGVKKLNSNKVYGFILSDGEFIVNEPDVVREQAENADKRFCYGDFDEFTFDDDLKNLAYIVLKDETKVSGSTTVEVIGELTEPEEETHVPKTKIGKIKFELAEALNTITDLQNPYKDKNLNAEQRYRLFNKSMRKVLDILDIDLDMHELLKTGEEGFSYSDSAEGTGTLETSDTSIKSVLIALHKDLTDDTLSIDGVKDLARGRVYDLADLIGINELSEIRDAHIKQLESDLHSMATAKTEK